MSEKYTIDQKLRGEDLYGLPKRIPDPTPEQAKCTHTETISGHWEKPDPRYRYIYDSEEEFQASSRWVPEYEKPTCVDIPGTNNYRCTQCGYTRRY